MPSAYPAYKAFALPIVRGKAMPKPTHIEHTKHSIIRTMDVTHCFIVRMVMNLRDSDDLR